MSGSGKSTLVNDILAKELSARLHRAQEVPGAHEAIDGIKQLRQRLEELAREFDALLARDATLEAQQRIGVSLVLAQKPWLLQLFLPHRRALDA